MKDTVFFEKFIDYLKIEKKSSDNTTQAYIKDITRFFDHASKQNVDVLTADRLFITDYRDYLLQSGLRATSVSRAISAVRSYYRFLLSIGAKSDNPVVNINSKDTNTNNDKHFEVLTQDEISLLMKQPDLHDPKGIRDKAMLEVLYATGMKVSELISLDLSDFFPHLNSIRCRNECKSTEPRLMLLYPVALKALETYIKTSRKYFADESESALFVNVNGSRITRQGLWKILKFYVSKARIDKTITPQTLRHSFATHLLENGAQLDDVCELLGHSDISSTQIYAKYLKTKVNGAVLKFHPRS